MEQFLLTIGNEPSPLDELPLSLLSDVSELAVGKGVVVGASGVEGIVIEGTILGVEIVTVAIVTECIVIGVSDIMTKATVSGVVLIVSKV